MGVNRDKPDLWKNDVEKSVDLYNEWFLKFAPLTFRTTRIETTKDVERALELSGNLANLKPDLLRQSPNILAILRMCCCPPIAKDRLIGLSKCSKSLVNTMESENKLPPRMPDPILKIELQKIVDIITKLTDDDIFSWLKTNRKPEEKEIYRASTIIADRLCTAVSDPIIRNEQERRQLLTLKNWLEPRGYKELAPKHGFAFNAMPAGTFCNRLNVPGLHIEKGEKINIPIDAVIMRKNAKPGDLPLLIEAKSAGDFTNVNKRRKEEGIKIAQLRNNHGVKLEFILMLCGYFDTGYLGYSAAEQIDWVWEHRLDDLALFGL